MDKKEDNKFDNEVLIADALLRLTTLEKLLIAKGIFTQEEFAKEMGAITSQIAKSILQKANIQGDLDKIISDLKRPFKKDTKN